ncbi:MAG: hypothetical protein JWM90_1347 [Thermoleophilia bacterium]|nr:hypothetical protein [Thermoleophilia bacterium]
MPAVLPTATREPHRLTFTDAVVTTNARRTRALTRPGVNDMRIPSESLAILATVAGVGSAAGLAGGAMLGHGWNQAEPSTSNPLEVLLGVGLAGGAVLAPIGATAEVAKSAQRGGARAGVIALGAVSLAAAVGATAVGLHLGDQYAKSFQR